MQPIKGQKFDLRQIFNLAEYKKRKNVYIEYIWSTSCCKCGEEIRTLDEEYSLTISTKKENLTVDECIQEFKKFQKNYDIYDDDKQAFEYIGYDELEEADIYYYYHLENNTEDDTCNICKQVFN